MPGAVRGMICPYPANTWGPYVAGRKLRPGERAITCLSLAGKRGWNKVSGTQKTTCHVPYVAFFPSTGAKSSNSSNRTVGKSHGTGDGTRSFSVCPSFRPLLKYSPAVLLSNAIMLEGGGVDTWNFSKTHPNHPSKAPLKAKSDVP